MEGHLGDGSGPEQPSFGCLPESRVRREGPEDQEKLFWLPGSHCAHIITSVQASIFSLWALHPCQGFIQ